MWTCSLLTIDPPLSSSGCVREQWERGREGKAWGGGEVVEHCSADKLMQQSRLSQQHTPSLARCLHQLVPMHGCLGDRLPRSVDGKQNTKNKKTFHPKIRLDNDIWERQKAPVDGSRWGAVLGAGGGGGGGGGGVAADRHPLPGSEGSSVGVGLRVERTGAVLVVVGLKPSHENVFGVRRSST